MLDVLAPNLRDDDLAAAREVPAEEPADVKAREEVGEAVLLPGSPPDVAGHPSAGQQSDPPDLMVRLGRQAEAVGGRARHCPPGASDTMDRAPHPIPSRHVLNDVA